MISQDDIDAFAPDLDAADRIVARAKAGVVDGRHINADEVLPFIRAYVLMRDLAAKSGQFMAEQHARELAGMAVEKRGE